jgi:hydrogenase expression/formation protein HypD
VKSITELAGDGDYTFMEVCGGHTHTIYRHGLEHLLPPSIELVHGPGCPVCVIPMGRVDDAVDNPARQVVYFAVGFETTAPSTAVTLARAKELGVGNFSVLCNHVTIVPPIKAILDSPDLRLSGFIGPGHVSTVVGTRPYRIVPEVYGKPLVVAGFEPLDILQSVYMLLAQLREGRCEVENQYSRVVRDEGNPAALALLAEVFELRARFEWRGLGFISQSALKLSPAYAEFDAELRYSMPGLRVADPKACQCGEVLKGMIKPWQCKVFGTACTPETPVGACMVSPEGACAAYYNFGRLHRETAALVGQHGAAAHD